MTDALMNRYYALADTQTIDSMEVYAQSWYILAADFGGAGRPAMAESCIGRWKQYRNEPAGEYIRLIEMPFSELIPVEAA
jgi:hypothetical protein